MNPRLLLRAQARDSGSIAAVLCLLVATSSVGWAATHVLSPEAADGEEKFETAANALQPGDELILQGGEYSQTGRRAITAKGTAERPIVIRAADGVAPLVTRSAEQRDQHNNIEFVDCAYLVIRGLRFRGGSCGVRFIRGHHVTFEDCEIFETGNNALTMNSGDCDHFIIRQNHIHHTGLSERGPTEGEGMYIGCHPGSCRTSDSVIERNYIHHLRSTSDGGNDGIEIKFGSHGNVVRDNVIHDTNIGRQYPGIFVYGGGPGTNLVEGNVIWRAGEGIQVVADAVVRNNIIFDCAITGITAAPHGAVPSMQNVRIINNTIVGAPKGVQIRWGKATRMVFSNNAVFCPGQVALDVSGLGSAVLRANYIEGKVSGVALDNAAVFSGGALASAFRDPAKHDFWPKAGCALIATAHPAEAAELDFNRARRASPLDVGAYETDGRELNPGWPIQAGFKR